VRYPFDFCTITTNNDRPRNDRKKVRKFTTTLQTCSRTTLKSGPVEGKDASGAHGAQVTHLDSKLVSLFDRVLHLQNELHDTCSQLWNASVSISSLELERSHHLAALNAGLVVEKAPVTTSLNGLMRTRDGGGCSAWPGENCTSGAEALKKTSTVSVRVSLIKRTMVAEVQLNQATRERKVPPGHAGPDTVSPGRKRCC
jgi:hypothetical protein